MGFFSNVKHFFSDSLPKAFKSLKHELSDDFDWTSSHVISPIMGEVNSGLSAVNTDIHDIASGYKSVVSSGISAVEGLGLNVVHETQQSIKDVSHGVSDSIDSFSSNLALPVAVGVGIAGIYLLSTQK